MNKDFDTNTRIPIFPISFYKSKVENNDEIKKLLVSKIEKDSEELPIPEGWFTNKLKTSFSGEKPGKEIFFGADNTYQSILEKKYAKCLDSFFDLAYQIMIDEIWYNCYSDGEYQEEHDHLNGPFNNCHFSCIHFLSFDKIRHKAPKFKDPLDQIRSTSLEFERNQYNSNYQPNIEEGDFIMFPSYLRHYVEPCVSTKDYPRITIAMNIQVLQYGINGDVLV
jgi:hypothetical protein